MLECHPLSPLHTGDMAVTNKKLVELIGDECRRSEARAQVLFALGVALRKLDDGEPNAIQHADTAIAESRNRVAKSGRETTRHE